MKALNARLADACRTGDESNVRKLLTAGATGVNKGLHEAASAGQRRIVDLLLQTDNKQPAVPKPNEFNWPMQAASQAGYADIVERLVLAGARHLNFGLRLACRFGRLAVVDVLLRKGATDKNRGLYDACLNGHQAVAEFLVSNGAYDLDRGLIGACTGGQASIVAWLLSKNAVKDINAGMRQAAAANSRTTVDLLESAGADNWIGALEGAVDRNCARMAEYALSRTKPTVFQLNNYLRRSRCNASITAVLLNAGATYASSVFDGRHDSTILLQLLEIESVSRSKLSGIRFIQDVFDIADANIVDVKSQLLSIDLPAVLHPIVVEYCVNLT